MVSDLVSFFGRKPAYWYRGTALAMIAVTILSGLVYGHHMFVSGMSPMLGHAFMLLTLIISVPAEILFLNWLHTIWKGSIRFTTPMLWALGFIFVFGMGGLTGIFLGAISTDMYLHDTTFVVGLFHLTMAAASLFASFAAIVYWFPKMFGRLMDERIGKLHFALTFVLSTLVFTGQLAAGWSGQQRRLFDPYEYTFLQHLVGLNRWTSWFAFGLGAAQLLFVWNFFHSLWRGRRAGDNPWQVGTLEWTIPSPPPPENFVAIPVVLRGPHEYAHPLARARLGRDWLSQSEPLLEGEEART